MFFMGYISYEEPDVIYNHLLFPESLIFIFIWIGETFHLFIACTTPSGTNNQIAETENVYLDILYYNRIN